MKTIRWSIKISKLSRWQLLFRCWTMRCRSWGGRMICIMKMYRKRLIIRGWNRGKPRVWSMLFRSWLSLSKICRIGFKTKFFSFRTIFNSTKRAVISLLTNFKRSTGGRLRIWNLSCTSWVEKTKIWPILSWDWQNWKEIKTKIKIINYSLPESPKEQLLNKPKNNKISKGMSRLSRKRTGCSMFIEEFWRS